MFVLGNLGRQLNEAVFAVFSPGHAGVLFSLVKAVWVDVCCAVCMLQHKVGFRAKCWQDYPSNFHVDVGVPFEPFGCTVLDVVAFVAWFDLGLFLDCRWLRSFCWCVVWGVYWYGGSMTLSFIVAR
ncbi:hypothetical protein [Escherichia coli]|uniref:hypothetical protein n=1 Tax=Escherichia coli TaxID=562 RepID=UPI001C5ED73D|nr:hypothetical protein [Escherichia coli]